MREPAGVAPEAQLLVQGAIAEGADQPIWLDQPRVGWSGAGDQEVGCSAGSGGHPSLLASSVTIPGEYHGRTMEMLHAVSADLPTHILEVDRAGLGGCQDLHP